LGTYGQLWIGSFHSKRPKKLWLTSKRDVQRGRYRQAEINMSALW
jgi:hypothetical protein